VTTNRSLSGAARRLAFLWGRERVPKQALISDWRDSSIAAGRRVGESSSSTDGVPKESPESVQDFASSAFYELIAAELARRGYRIPGSAGFAGKIPRTAKLALLSGALAALGPHALVAVGAGIRRLAFDPTLEVMLRAADARDLLARWSRLERYHHGRHRVRLLAESERSLVTEHYAVEGAAPTLGEDLVVCGLLAALLQELGCRGLDVDVGSARHPVIRRDRVRELRRWPGGSAGRWHFSWSSFASRRASQLPSLDASRSMADRVTALLLHDLGRGWRLATASRSLGTSSRSLQRALAREGRCFQDVLRRARVDDAARLLLERDRPLTEIGYTCGFADQAHFTREFKTRFNMTPGTYRELTGQRSAGGR
jgi:AraC-like DNA-binding protein